MNWIALALLAGLIVGWLWWANRPRGGDPYGLRQPPAEPRPVAPQAASPATAKRALSEGPLRTAAPGRFEVSVVGEFHHQDALRRVVGVMAPTARPRRFKALLVPEPDNPHDPMALRVEIAGELVGYLGRRDAELFHVSAEAEGLVGRAVQTDARVFARGGMERGEGAVIEVELDINLYPVTFRGDRGA